MPYHNPGLGIRICVKAFKCTIYSDTGTYTKWFGDKLTNECVGVCTGGRYGDYRITDTGTMVCITGTECTTTYSGVRYDGDLYTETGLYNQKLCNVNCYHDYQGTTTYDYYDSSPTGTHICLELCPSTLPNRDPSTGLCVVECPATYYSSDTGGNKMTGGYTCV